MDAELILYVLALWAVLGGLFAYGLSSMRRAERQAEEAFQARLLGAPPPLYCDLWRRMRESHQKGKTP